MKANDPVAVAGMTLLPFMNEDSIRDAAQFREKIYKLDFTAKNRACIQRGKAVYDRDGENKDNFVIFCREQIFVFTNTPGGFFSRKSASTTDALIDHIVLTKHYPALYTGALSQRSGSSAGRLAEQGCE